MPVVNLTDGEITHTVRARPSNLKSFQGQRVVFITDEHTSMGRIKRAQDAVSQYAISSKCVNHDFTEEFMHQSRSAS